ncbi:hypothetical protein AAC61_03385 [Salmonella enterica subsp. enterica serovar Infantis]|nr:hypothetical protein [Salmonella enterica subsp. enterica serovar Infantis]
MFILSLGYIIFVATMIISIFRVHVNKEDFDVIGSYFNNTPEHSKFAKYVYYCLYAWAIAWVLSLILPVLTIVCMVINLVLYIVAWIWIYECYKDGHMARWFNDIKAKLNP